MLAAGCGQDTRIRHGNGGFPIIARPPSRTRLPPLGPVVLAVALVVCGSPVPGWAQPPPGLDAASPSDITPMPVAPATIARDESGRVTVRAVRVSQAPVIDGHLNDEIYSQSESFGDFIQQEPREGDPSTERTEVWLLFDDRQIYVAARCWDTHPERMIATDMRRDSSVLGQNDNFGVIFDTFHDRRNGFFFYTNPLGGFADIAVTDETNSNREWNTLWEVRTRRSGEGWTLEMAIPFQSLRYARAGQQVWGVNFRRVIRSKNEITYLTRMSAAYGMRAMQKLSSAATLVGLVAPAARAAIEVKPYALASVATDLAADDAYRNDPGGNAGFDVKAGLGKGLVADFTYRTDFAQVEEDEQQVNLTRFSVFFPERRDFFLEGQGIFAFAGAGARPPTSAGGWAAVGNTPVLFFSRRIGLHDEETTVPITAGARLTGKVGKYTIGLLDIHSGEVPAAGARSTNFAVARLKRDILRRSAVGVMATYRSEAEDGSGPASAFGVDASLAFYDNLSFNMYWAATRTGGTRGKDQSYRGQARYEGDKYGFEVDHVTVQPNFRPEVGFLRREDFRRNFGKARFSPRPEWWKAVRRLNFEASLEQFTDNRGVLESQEAEGLFRVQYLSGDIFTVEYSNYYELLAEPFDVTDEAIVPPGGYHFQDAEVSYLLGPQRPVNGTVSVVAGSFYDGTKRQVGFRGRVDLVRSLTLEPGITLARIKAGTGAFHSTLATMRATYAFSPRMVFAGLIQVNTKDGVASANLRYRWEFSPGSELFVVYSEGRDMTQPTRLPALETRSFVVKITRLFRF
ncbi:MAG: DUF5916 domain-containing protein [Acidobacteriota bacterium]